MSDEKTYTVTTPNPHFTGIRDGVQFKKGEGQADEETARRLVNIWGYNCEALAEDTTDDAPEVSTDMNAKPAIAHIEDTPLEELEGFVPEDEDRTTVLKAWEEKQSDEDGIADEADSADETDEDEESGEADSEPESS